MLRCHCSNPICMPMDESIRLCIDYRALNCLSILKKYPLPLSSKLLDKARGGKWFTSLDLKNEYNLISIAAGDDWKTGFCRKQGLFKYTVMPFDLTNASISFQEMLDTIFKGMEACI